MKTSMGLPAVMAGVLLLAGCTTVPPRAGFEDVQKSLASRTGAVVEWRGRTASDAAVDERVHRLLAEPLTADRAVAVALLNNPSLQATYEDLGIAQADLVQAGLLNNPVLSLERRFSGQATEIDLFADFIQVFSIPLRKKIAAADFEAARSRVAQAVLDTAAEVRRGFYELQGSEQVLEMTRTVLRSASDAELAARELRRAGNSSLLDLRAQQSLTVQARLQLAQAELQVTEGRERLSALMGLWGPVVAQWKLPPRLPDPPADGDIGPDLESIAVAHRLDLAASRSEVESAARSLGYTETFRFVPQLEVGAHYEHEVEPRHSIGPSVSLQVPIFDQGQARIARERAMLDRAQRRYRALAIRVRSEVRLAYARLVAARQTVEFYRQSVLPLDREVVQQTQLHYNGMFTGVLSLIEAKRAEIEAGRSYIATLQSYWIARSDLQHALGTRLPAAPKAARITPSNRTE